MRPLLVCVAILCGCSSVPRDYVPEPGEVIIEENGKPPVLQTVPIVTQTARGPVDSATWYQSEYLFVGCQVADAATTIAAVKRGAVEMNPLFKSTLQHRLWAGFLAEKGIVIWLGIIAWDHITPEAKTGFNVASCLPPINNLYVLKEMQ